MKALSAINGERLSRYLPVGTVFVLAAGLRFFNLGKQSLFLDEAWSWVVARLDVYHLIALSFSDPHPPLYYALLKFYIWIIPDTEFSMRALSVVFSLLGLVTIMVFTHERWGTQPAIFAGLFMALSTFDIYYAQETRMYTMTGFLWIASYFLLLRGLEGDRRFLYFWAGATILLAWTHLINLLVAVVYMGAGGWILISHRKFSRFHNWQASTRDLLANVILIGVGVLPILGFSLLHQSDYNAAGAWLPSARDLVNLFLAWTTGLTSVRGYFLDSANLTLPQLAALPKTFWLGIGILIGGFPAVWGVVHNWRKDETKRAAIILSLVASLGPVLLAFGYAILAQRPIWAFKPYVGAGYFFFIWVGLGMSAIPISWLRKTWITLIVLVSAASLIPYNHQWQKSRAGDALQSLPTLSATGGLFFDPSYFFPLVNYYTEDKDIPLVSVMTTGELFLIEASEEMVTGRREEVKCHELDHLTDFWFYKEITWINKLTPELPECIQSKQLWEYQNSEWVQVPPNR